MTNEKLFAKVKKSLEEIELREMIKVLILVVDFFQIFTTNCQISNEV